MGFSLGGGGGSTNYKSKNIPEYEDWASSGIANRAGVRKTVNPEYTKFMEGQSTAQPATGATGFGYNPATGKMEAGYASGGSKFSPSGTSFSRGKAPAQYTYDTSAVGAPVGRDSATAPYSKDLDLISEANQGFRTPYQFKGLPEKYGDLAFASGSKDVRRQGQGDLEKIQESVGVRRPGLLLKAGQNNQRNVAEQLAKMRTDIDLNVMDKNLDTDRAQADENFRNRDALQKGASNKVQLESGITESERAYQDQALKYLMDIYLGSADAMKGTKGSWNVGVQGLAPQKATS